MILAISKTLSLATYSVRYMPQPRFKFINNNIQDGIKENSLLQIEKMFLSVLRLQNRTFCFSS